jgi:hypothetical protein
VLYGLDSTPVGEVIESATIALNGQQARITMALGRELGPPIIQRMFFACQDVHTGNAGACTDSDPQFHEADWFNLGTERFPGSPSSILPPNSDYVIKFQFSEIAETTAPREYINPILTSAEIACNSSQTPVCKFSPSTFGEVPAGTIGTGDFDGGAAIYVGLQGGQTTTITYQGIGGEDVSIGLLRGTLSAYTQVSVYDPTNKRLISSPIIGSGDFDYKNGVSGTHRITLLPSGTESGHISLYLSATIQTSAPLAGDPSPVTIGTPGQNADYSFIADAGYLVSIALSGSTFDSNYIDVSVYRPDGARLASHLALGTDQLDLPKLPSSGYYRIRLDPRLGATAGTGSVAVTLSTAVGGSVVVDGAATNATISRIAQDAYIDFQGAAGQQLSLALTNNTLTDYFGVDVYRPDGVRLASHTALGTDQLDLPKLPSSGTYRIRLNPRLGGAGAGTGSVTLTLSTVAVGSISVGSSTTITTTRPAQDAYLDFQGSSGQLLRVSFYLNTMGQYVDAEVRNPSGSVLWSGLIGSNGRTVDLPALPTTGTHRIHLDPRLGSNLGQGSMTVALVER